MPVRQPSQADAILAKMRAQYASTRASLNGQRSAQEVAAVRRKIIADRQPRPKLVVRPKTVQAKRTAVGKRSPLRRSQAPTTGATRPAPDLDGTPREPTPAVDELRQLADLMRFAGGKRFTGAQLRKFVTNSQFRSTICRERMRLNAEAAARRRAQRAARAEKEELDRYIQDALEALPPLGSVRDKN